MARRIVSLWFRYLLSDWLIIKKPELQGTPFVFVRTEHNMALIIQASQLAQNEGARPGMRAADAKAIVPGLVTVDEKPGREVALLRGLAEWCVRYSPIVAIDLGGTGLFLDATGCTHLWGGEAGYLAEIVSRLKSKGYQVRAGMADTMGAAWAVARFGQQMAVVESGLQAQALLPFPPAALRLEQDVLARLQKLGFYRIKSFIGMPRSVLRRRFGEGLLLRLAQALGQEEEVLVPIQVPAPYLERLPCLELIRTATGITIAIEKLLEAMCLRLQGEGKGVRTAVLKCYRVDGKIEQAEIGTSKASHSVGHLLKLFELRIPSITPALGIELFVLEGNKVEDTDTPQDALWKDSGGTLQDKAVAELIDRLKGKAFGADPVKRYLPREHYWPERSIKTSSSLDEKSEIEWRSDLPRPVRILATPERVEVTAPIPDYPPMVFRYQGEAHHIKKSDGPERIEREWWLEPGEHRDYYVVEDERGQRYWIFRSGHYQPGQSHQWFLHGFFA